MNERELLPVVICACDPTLRRVVLGTERMMMCGQRVVACLRCGTLGAYQHRFEPIEGDPLDRSMVVGFTPVDLSPQTRAWMSEFPRRTGSEYDEPKCADDIFFLPAATRCDDEAQLADIEARVCHAPPTTPLVRRLLDAGLPASSAPADVPGMFYFFAKSVKLATLPQDAPADALLTACFGISPPVSWLVEPRLPHGAELSAAIVALVERDAIDIAYYALPRLRANPQTPNEVPTDIVDAIARSIQRMTAPAQRSMRLRLVNQLGAYDALAAQRLRSLLPAELLS